MRADAKVIDYLNLALKSELTAINQYWLHYRILDNWGYKELAKTWREESIEEMRHADTLTARILFLEGYPNMQSINPLRIGQSVQEIIDCDLVAENEARALYLDAAKHCESVNDRVFFLLLGIVVTCAICLALVWPQGMGARSPAPFGGPTTAETTPPEPPAPAQVRGDLL